MGEDTITSFVCMEGHSCAMQEAPPGVPRAGWYLEHVVEPRLIQRLGRVHLHGFEHAEQLLRELGEDPAGCVIDLGRIALRIEVPA